MHVVIPVLERRLTEICTPGPAHDHRLDGVPLRGDSELAVAVEGDRPDVRRGQAVDAHEIVRRLAQLLDRVGDVHVQQAGGVVETLHVVREPEDGRALRGLVAPYALEHARAVVKPVDTDVHLGVGPVDELAVHPDLRGLLHHAPPCSGRSSLSRKSISTTLYDSCAMSTSVPRVSRTSSSGREHRHVPLGSAANPDDGSRDDRPLDEHERAGRNRNGRDGPGREAGDREYLVRSGDTVPRPRPRRSRSSPDRRGGRRGAARERVGRRIGTRAT